MNILFTPFLFLFDVVSAITKGIFVLLTYILTFILGIVFITAKVVLAVIILPLQLFILIAGFVLIPPITILSFIFTKLSKRNFK